jgi:hypothetical protein
MDAIFVLGVAGLLVVSYWITMAIARLGGIE